MILPQPDDFPSQPTPDGRGRVYEVQKRTRLVAYAIDDRETLRTAGATDGFILFAFLEAKILGYWNWTTDPAELVRMMLTYRAAHDPSLPRPAHLAPGGEPAMIHPKFGQQVENDLARRGFELDER